MSTTPFELVQRHIVILGFALVAANLIYVRRKARPLIDSGVVTRSEVDGLVKQGIALFALAATALWLLQGFTANPHPSCLARFPPSDSAGVGLWLIQATFSAIVLWWLWARNGAELLARMAPAFMPGTAIQRQYSPRQLRLAITGLVLLVPLWVIGLQEIIPMEGLCKAI
jgi:hypothetical protein